MARTQAGAIAHTHGSAAGDLDAACHRHARESHGRSIAYVRRPQPVSDRHGFGVRARHGHRDASGYKHPGTDGDIGLTHGHPFGDLASYADAFPAADSHADLDAFAHAVAFRDCDPVADLDAVTYSDAHANGDVDPCSYCHAVAHSDHFSHSDRLPHGDGHRDGDLHPYTVAHDDHPAAVADLFPNADPVKDGMMNDLKTLLKSWLEAPGLSGHEGPIRDSIHATWEPLADEITVSPLGSLHALRRGTAPDPRPRLLFAAHMDAIGLMVSALEGEFLRITTVGGVDARVLPGQLVVVHGREDLPGVVVQPPDRLLPPEAQSKPVAKEHLLVDTGLSARQLARRVRPGDLVSFAQPPLELLDDALAGHSLDNRASVAALTHCLRWLKNRSHAWDVWAVATVQEEVGLIGAATSAFALRPDLAVAVDVTFGKGPGANDYRAFPIGEGITLGWGPNIHPGLYRKFEEVARRLEIPFHREVMPRHSGTDAMALQVAAEGIPTMVVSIPLRYMHTPVEVVSLKDVERAGRLLAEFAAALETDFLEGLSYD